MASVSTPARLVRCHVLGKRSGTQCTAEALDPDGEILICSRHAAAVLEMVNIKIGRKKP